MTKTDASSLLPGREVDCNEGPVERDGSKEPSQGLHCHDGGVVFYLFVNKG